MQARNPEDLVALAHKPLVLILQAGMLKLEVASHIVC